MIVPRNITAMAPICLVVLIALSWTCDKVVSDDKQTKSTCAVILEDLKQVMLTTKINSNANSKRPLIMQMLIGEPDRREIAKRCEKICKDCPHEGGKMCK